METGLCLKSEGRPLLTDVQCYVDDLNRFVAHGQGLLRSSCEGIVTVGHHPPFCPQRVHSRDQERPDLTLVNRSAPTVVIQLSGFALDRDQPVVATPFRHHINSRICDAALGKVLKPIRPVLPKPSLRDIPLLHMRSHIHSQQLQPLPVGYLRALLCYLGEGRIDDLGSLCRRSRHNRSLIHNRQNTLHPSRASSKVCRRGPEHVARPSPQSSPCGVYGQRLTGALGFGPLIWSGRAGTRGDSADGFPCGPVVLPAYPGRLANAGRSGLDPNDMVVPGQVVFGSVDDLLHYGVSGGAAGLVAPQDDHS